MHPERTKEDVAKEYAQHCAQLGENHYRIAELNERNDYHIVEIAKLNKEAHAIAEAAKAQEPQAEVANG